MQLSISQHTLHVHALDGALGASTGMLNNTTWARELERQHKADENTLPNDPLQSATSTPTPRNRLVDVETLSLSFNALEGVRWLTPSLFPRLRVLDVSHNGLKSLDGLTAVRTTLEVLRCNNNLLTELPSVDQWCTAPFLRLHEVWLSRNRLKHVLDVVDTLSSPDCCPSGIRTLVVYQNNFTNVLSDVQVRYRVVRCTGGDGLSVPDFFFFVPFVLWSLAFCCWCVQLKHLFHARMPQLDTFDGRAVTSVHRSKSQAYWTNELGTSILQLIRPTPKTKLERLQSTHRKQGGRAVGSDDKPWRR